MKKNYLILTVLHVILSCTAVGAEVDIGHGEKLFLELWNENSYRKTEFGANEPGYEEVDYLISQLWLQSGLRYELTDDVFFDPHFTLEVTGDWSSEEWNDVYWNNIMLWGVGARVSYETFSDDEDEQVVWISDCNIELFADLMFSERSLDQGKNDIPEDVSTDNLRTGISIWTALDTRAFFVDTTSIWAEMYGELTYENKGFAEKEYENFYLFTLELLTGPQFPVHEIYLQPYYALYLTRDLGDESWNREPWLNNVTYGPGFRISMGSLIPVENADLYLYIEYLEIDYLSRVDQELYMDTADDDVRLGIEIYLPFGATQDRIRRH